MRHLGPLPVKAEVSGVNHAANGGVNEKAVGAWYGVVDVDGLNLDA